MVTIADSVKIEIDEDVPNGTYFRTGDAEPYVDGQTIYIYDGRGSRRSWGAPGVSSNVVLETPDIVAIHVGFRHKHGGGQFWRYYRITGDGIKQIGWRSIDDDIRAAILEAAGKYAPLWANSPGELRTNYKSANPKANAFTAYKICGINDNGELTSLYDADITYELGKTKVQAARGGVNERNEVEHNGGWYVYADATEIVEKYLSGHLVGADRVQPRAALVECECWGNVVNYPNGKMAVTYCKPQKIVGDVIEMTKEPA